MLTLAVQLSQTADCSQLVLTDITPLYSVTTPGGWGFPNASFAAVASVYVSGTYRPYPALSPVQVIPSTELMPSPTSLPYLQGQAFVLTPTLLGLGSANFGDGIYTLTYSVSVNTYMQITSGGTNFPGSFSIGNTIQDLTTGQILGTVEQAAGDVLTLENLTGYLPSGGDVLSNGSANLTLNSSITVIFTAPVVTYTVTIQCEITCGILCCLGTSLSGLVLNNNCQAKNIKNVFFNVFVPLIISQAQAGCGQNNSALNSLAVAENNCNGGCGC